MNTKTKTPKPCQPDPLVEHLLGDELAAQDEALLAAEEAAAVIDRHRAELAELQADTDGDVDDLAAKIAAKREAITLAERRAAAAASDVVVAGRRVAAAEERAFRSDEIIARRREILLDDGGKVAAAIDALLDRLVVDILEATAEQRLVSKSIAAERKALYAAASPEDRPRFGTVPRWTGGPPTKNLDNRTQSFIDQARDAITGWPYAHLVARAFIGEGGYDRCEGLPVRADELSREQQDEVLKRLDRITARRWLHGDAPDKTAPRSRGF